MARTLDPCVVLRSLEAVLGARYGAPVKLTVSAAGERKNFFENLVAEKQQENKGGFSDGM